jgi:hypothetical protein
MAEIRETHIERDADGNVVDTKVVERRKRGGGFGWGMIFGLAVLAVAIVAFAYSQGSFQQAGVEADQATAQLEEQTEGAVDATGSAIENAGDQVEAAGDQAANETSDTATN